MTNTRHLAERGRNDDTGQELLETNILRLLEEKDKYGQSAVRWAERNPEILSLVKAKANKAERPVISLSRP